MPTPSDSTDALPLERERSAHTTCPPEDDRSGQWRAEVLNTLDRTGLDSTIVSGESRRPQDLANEARCHSPLDTLLDQPEDQRPKPGPHTDPAESTTPLVGASPYSSHTDEKEVEQSYPAASTSSALDFQYSIRYGIGSTRVCPKTH